MFQRLTNLHLIERQIIAFKCLMQYLLTCFYCTFYKQNKWTDGWKTRKSGKQVSMSFLRTGTLYVSSLFTREQHCFIAAVIPGIFLWDLCECCLHVQLLPERTEPSAGWQRFTDRWRDCISEWSEGRKFAVVCGRGRHESDNNVWAPSTVAVSLSVESLWPVTAQSSPL